MPSSYDLRLVRYIPLGSRQGVIPTLTIETVRPDDVPVVRFSLSTKVAGTLPQFMEVAVEWWNGDRWEEGRDHRFMVENDARDDTDPTGVYQYTGINLVTWFLGKGVMEGEPIDTYTGGTVRANRTVGSVTGVDVVGEGHTRFTRAGHGFVNGDSVVVTNKGNSKFRRATRYWVLNATSNTFELRGSVKGPRVTALEKKQTSVRGLEFSRVQDRIEISHNLRLNDKIKFLSATGAGLSGDQSYYVVKPFGPSYFGVASQAGGAPIMLQNASNVSFYTDRSRDRGFRTATPGALMDLLLREAKARGWAPGITWNFTGAVDSAGVPWAQKVEGIDGTPFMISAGTNFRQVLATLRDQGLVETYFTTRELRMFNPGTGVDRGSSTNPVKVSRAALALPIDRDRSRILTHLTAIGEANIQVAASDTTHAAGLGRLEGWETLSGIASKNLALALVKSDLSKVVRPQTEYRLTEPGASAQFLPGIDYDRGDWVQVYTGGAWASLRVVELVTTKERDGTVKVSTVFDSRKKSLLARLAQRQAQASGGVTRGGTGKAIEVKDTRRPAMPTQLTAESVGEYTSSGATVARVVTSWFPVVGDEDGNALDIVGYEVWIRTEGDVNAVRAGATEGLTLTSGPYASGDVLYASVRAQSASGTWSEFTEEETVTAAIPLEPPLPPTPPVVTAKLGQVRVTWDGNVVDADGDTLAPPAGFAFVYVTMATSVDGEYVPVSSNMGNAGSVSLSGIPRGEVRWFKLQSVTTVGVVSAASEAVEVTVVGATGPDFEANTITTNELAAGAVTAEILSLGAAPSRGTPTDRVPAPLTDVEYWTSRQEGKIPFGEASTLWTATVNGLVLEPSALSFANVAITRQTLVPPSRRVHVHIAASAPALIVLRWWLLDGSTVVANIPADTTYTFPDDALTYRVELRVEAEGAPATVAAAQVFEVIGTTGADRQGVYIDPSGLLITNSDGSGAINLSTNSDQFISIMAATDTGYEAVASIDSAGAGYFQDLAVDDEVSVRGTDLLGGFEEILRNGEQDEGSVFDRLSRGVVTSGYIRIPENVTYNDDFRTLAVIPFDADAGRRYKLSIDSSVAMINPAGQGVAHLEILLSTTKLPLRATSGYTVLRQTGFVPADGQKTDQYNLNRAMSAGTAPDQTTVAVGRNYLTIRMRTANGASLRFVPGVDVATVAIEDIGPAFGLMQFTNNVGSGSPSGGGEDTTPEPPASSVTRQIAATWSRTWTGGSILTGSSQYTNGKMLYQGSTSGLRWSYFGFPPLGIAGRSISSCRLFLQNRHTYSNAGGTARLGTHGFGSPPEDRTSRQNAFDVGWGRTQGKWINVPSNLWSGIASGAIRGFSLGTSTPTGTDFAYFDGVGASKSPNLLITYK